MNLFAKKPRAIPFSLVPKGKDKLVAVWVRDPRTGRLVQRWQDPHET